MSETEVQELRKQLSTLRDDVYTQLARQAQALEDLAGSSRELNDWTRSRNCSAHQERLDKLEARLEHHAANEHAPRSRPPSAEQPPRSQTNQALQAVGHLADSLVEVTDRMAIPRQAEPTFEERLAQLEAYQDRLAERPHKALRRWSETLRASVIPAVLAALAAAGAVGASRCELRPRAEPAPRVQQLVRQADASVHR